MADGKKSDRHESDIDANLKRVYQELVDEEVPDRFRDLLAQLKAQDTPPDEGKDQ